MAPSGLQTAVCLCVVAGLILGIAACDSKYEGIDTPTIYLSETGDPRSMDPHKAGDVVSSRQCGMVYESLYQFDYFAYPVKLVPCLAEGDPQYDPETLTYVFTLRDDVYFHDDRCFHPDAANKYFEQETPDQRLIKGKGRKLVARDIEYSIKRLAALPDSGGFWVLEHKIDGLDAFREEAVKLKSDRWESSQAWYRYFDTPVSGIKVLDDRRISVKLLETYPQFLFAMTLSYGAAVPKEAAEYYGDQLTRNPVGTGPYVLERWWEQKEIVWVRNQGFRRELFPVSTDSKHELWKPLMGRELPVCDRVVYRIIKEPQPSFREFLDGRLAASGMDKDQFTQAVTTQQTLTPELMEAGVRLRSYPEPTIQYICFNMNDSVVGTSAGEKGRAIRKAIAHGFNRVDYIRRMLNDRGEPAGQLVPPGMPGHLEGYYMQSQRFDLNLARQVLRDAGFKLTGSGERWVCIDPDTGRQVSVNMLHRASRDTSRDYAAFLDNLGRRIGIKIENELLTFSEFLRRQDEGIGQAFIAGWVMDYPDAQNMLQLLYGPNKPPGINASSYLNEEYDRLYREMSMLDQEDAAQFAKKLELIRRMSDIVDRDVPWVLVNFQVIFSLYHEWFYPQPWEPFNAFMYNGMKYFYVDPARVGTTSRRSPFIPGFLLVCFALLPVVLMGWRIFQNQR